jgi:hypothetical protein
MSQLILVVIYLLFASSGFSFAEEMTLVQAQKSWGNYEVSCKDMTLVRSVGMDNLYSKMQVLKFNKSICEKFLLPTPINSIISPVLQELVDANADQSQEPAIDVEQVKRREAEIFNRGGRAVHMNARQLADACLASAAGREKKETILCYFGGPKLESSAAFKTMFNAMLADSLPDLEPICSSEPLTQKSCSDSLFKSILSNDTSMSWRELQTTLRADGFECVAEHCIRNVMGLVIAVSVKMREQLQMRPNEKFLLVPRYLHVYRGDWHVIGPSYNGCFRDKNGKKSGHFCDGPSNAVLNGICLAKEDFHTWYGFSFLLNYASSGWAHDKP